ncbi:DMT family transporter [Azohydromonas aeria]|uniref:DMT family transporter n=1 Tax=Azohydromonas aeria TaxID=2590212 RepID=UPI0012FC12B9|nr:DMT family transporter [Azohydromonas aeria]
MRLSARTLLLLTLPPLLWAGNAVVGRLMVGSVPPLTLNFLRWLLAAALLLPLGWRVLRRGAEVRARWPYLLLTGTLGVGMYNALQYLALVSSTPLNVTLIASSMPVWMLLVGALFWREHPRPRQWLGAALSLSGVLCVLARGDVHALAQVRFVRGDLYVVVAIVAWAFYSWLLARPPASMRGAQRPGWHWSEALLLQVLFGLLGAGAAAGAEQLAGTHAVRWDSPWTLAALLYVALGPALLAYRCWGLGVATAGPALAAFFSNLTPLFAALMSAAVLGELPHWYHGAAFALIVAGIAVSQRRG